MATLRDEIAALLQSIGPDLIPQAQGLPAVAPQSVQSGNRSIMGEGADIAPGFPRFAPQSVQGGAPTPENAIGQRSQEEERWLRDNGPTVLGFVSSAADPLGLPSAITGIFSPERRENWRQAQRAGGIGPRIVGGAVTGFGLANALMRGGGALLGMGGNAMAGTGGRVAGAGAAGSAPTIDYMNDAPDSSAVNALAFPAAGALMAGQGTGLGGVLRPYLLPAGGAAAAAGLAGTYVGDADAQAPKAKGGAAPARPTTPAPAPQSATGAPVEQLDPRTVELHNTNPELRALYEQMRAARAARDRARRRAEVRDNDASVATASDANRSFEAAQTAYTAAVRRATQANLPFDQAFPNLSENYAALQFLGPAALAYVTRGAGNAVINAYTEPWRRAVRVAEGNLNTVIGARPGSAAERIAMGRGMVAANTATSYLNNGRAPTALGAMNRANDVVPIVAGGALGAELSWLPHQHNRRLPEGTPARNAADAAIGNPLSQALTAVPGMVAGAVGGFGASHLPFAPMLGRQHVAPVERTNALRRMMTGDVTPEFQTLAGNINAMRPQPAQIPQQQRPALPPPADVPPVPPPAAPNLPVDYDTIARGIRPGFERPPFVPPAVQPPTPNPPVPPVTTNRGATLYQNDVQTSIRDQMAAQLLGPGGAINVGALVSRMRREGIMPGVISRAQTAAQAANAMVQGGVPASEVARRITAGDFRHLAVPAGVTAAGAAAHHSATQPRGDNGRFQSPEE